MMNVNTGELISGELMALLQKEGSLKQFTEVPEELQGEAIKALYDKDRTVIDLDSDSPLAEWAAEERRKQKQRNTHKGRRKMAKASKRVNRR